MSEKTPITEHYIGLMSGTSLDGIDTVLVSFQDSLPKLIATHSHPIPPKFCKKIIEMIQPNWQGNLSDIGVLNQELGELFAAATNSLIEQNQLELKSIKAIGSHGQTLWHQPNGKYPFSMQLGDANLIAEKTGITTIADFRSRDIAAGGQGAPLVPAFHQALFSHPEKNRVILNIGGIANITVLPATKNKSKIQGYDTGPGNGLIDAWVLKHSNHSFDRNGDWARSGTILPTVLDKLLSDSYFAQHPPKSTGKEAFNLTWLGTILGKEITTYASNDIQATLTELSAKTIADNIKGCDELFICGGGIHNTFLLERLQYHLPNIDIASTNKLGVDPDWMEAIAFAWLAKQTLYGKPSNLPEVTGSIGSRILGVIYPA